MAKTKHAQILAYIEGLEVDQKISVRQLAHDLNVSEGTAYRGIKEAESRGLVRLTPKVGTIRIADQAKRMLDKLSYTEIAAVLEGEVLSGLEKLDASPKSYVVGITLNEIHEQTISDKTLVITSQQSDIQRYALLHRSPLLITGGAHVSPDYVKYAQKYNIPLIVTPFDTFVSITIINKTLSERVDKRSLMRINDIMKTQVEVLQPYDTVADWHDLSLRTGHSRFPIVNHANELQGLITSVHVANVAPGAILDDIMDVTPFTVKANDLVSHLSRHLLWERNELVPVVDEQNHLIGIVSRQDIIHALQNLQKQPQFGETIDNLSLSGFQLVAESPTFALEGRITDFMLNEYGVASTGNLTTLLTSAALIAARVNLKLSCYVHHMSFYQVKHIMTNDLIRVHVHFMTEERNNLQVEVHITENKQICAKCHLLLRVFKTKV